MILECDRVKKNIDDSTKSIVQRCKDKYNVTPSLDVFLVSDDEASKRYVKNKEKKADELGIITNTIKISKEKSTDEVVQILDNHIRKNPTNMIMIQLPTYDTINNERLINSIRLNVDVEGLTDLSKQALYYLHNIKNVNTGINIPCTAGGVFILINEHFILQDLNVCIVGRSDLVGKPLAKLLENNNCNVTILHSKTSRESMKKHFNTADVIVTAVGRDDFTITKDMFDFDKKVTIIDVGIKFKDGKMYGDCDRYLYEDKNITVTRTPRGTAQLTLSMLMYNTAKSTFINLSKLITKPNIK